MSREAILEIQDLSVEFQARGRRARALDGVTLQLRPGETLGLIGESGSGKSIVAWSVLGLLPSPGQIVAGRVVLEGRDLLSRREEELRTIRGRDLALIVQNARAHLNPLLRVGDQVAEVYRGHHDVSLKDARRRALEMLTKVAIPDPEERLRAYPHELSGGMAQRVLIAMATINEPKVLVADEPTMGLDVTIQTQILDLLRQQVEELGASALLITRDLGIAANYCDRIAVLYAGRIVEVGPVERVFDEPRHPYTIRLLHSSRFGTGEALPAAAQRRSVPPPARDGCAYSTRCPLADQTCREAAPALLEVEPDRDVSCHHQERVGEWSSFESTT
ncbi:MAG TPA: ABC transporter ATP-binding protein [Actinomycetes bacterium]|nr:ABC transporter ATP-binding protein [Actinomycetes bacterium]